MRKEFKQFFDDNFKPGQEVQFTLADASLHPTTERLPARLTDNQNIPLATYGCSGTRIMLEPAKPLDGIAAGSLLRVFALGWKN